jgi:ATP-dependent DNA ligase
VGCRAYGSEDDGAPVVKTAIGRAIRVRGMEGDNHLRHSKFIALREDKRAKDVRLGVKPVR